MAQKGRRGWVGALAVVVFALAAMLAAPAGAQALQPDRRAEAGALTRIALDARAELRERASLVDGGLERLERFPKRCPALRRISGRAPDEAVEALSIALYVRFVYGPILGPLDRFAGALEATAVTDGTLRAGVAGWRKTVEIVQTLARLPSRLCAAARRWGRSGYAPARAPVDATAIATAERRGERVETTIDRAAHRLRELGSSAEAAHAFTIDGLLEAAFPDELSESEAGSSGSGASQAGLAARCRSNSGAC